MANLIPEICSTEFYSNMSVTFYSLHKSYMLHVVIMELFRKSKANSHLIYFEKLFYVLH